jgi:hypothetical protein
MELHNTTSPAPVGYQKIVRTNVIINFLKGLKQGIKYQLELFYGWRYA